MSRLTINFSNKYEYLHEKLSKEKNSSQVVCKALEEYYGCKVVEDEEFESTIISRLDILLEKVENIENEITIK